MDLLLEATAVACVVLALARFCDNISFHQPLQLVTSGAEEEALFSIWNAAHGQPVYTDPRAIPYAASYFNWLFYALYGSAAGFTLRLFHLNDAWLPTVCRLLTLGLAATGSAVFFLALRTSNPKASSRSLLAPAIIALFNPLCGFWLITTRPDIGAAVLELTGLALFFQYLRSERPVWMVLTALSLYAAWSFKQTAVSALAGIGLTLLVLRDWRGLLLLAGLWSVGVLLALATLGPDYRHGLYLSQIHAGFRLRWGVQFFITAVSKTPFILLALAFIPWIVWIRKTAARWDRMELAATLTVGTAFVLEAIASCKGGAADYYFIPLSIWSLLWLRLAAPGLPARWRDGSLASVCVLMIAGVIGVFFGWRGTLDKRNPHLPFEHLARYLALRPGPVFVQSTYGDLPWISPTAPHFVIAYMYGLDRTAGMRFERGGLDALLTGGYFTTVVTDATATGETMITPAMLPDYRLVREEAGFRYFERK